MYDINRRNFLAFLGVAGGGALLAPRLGFAHLCLDNRPFPGRAFTAVRLPHELPWFAANDSYLPSGIDSGSVGSYPGELAAYTVFDDVVVPPEFERYVILSWGDRVFPKEDDYVGYNCDFTAYVPINGNSEGFLSINHEYISFPLSKFAPEVPSTLAAVPGIKTSAVTVLGVDLDTATQLLRWGELLDRDNSEDGRLPLRSPQVFRQFLPARPVGSQPECRARRQPAGTGRAAYSVFSQSVDGFGRKIIGTGFNCSGAQTPWGTVLSCEENFQGSPGAFFVGVQEWVGPSGTQIGWNVGDAADAETYTTGAYFGLVGEKYGYVVEIDPADRLWRARKHTALGRFRHENVALRVETGSPVIAYMGDDRRAGHTRKFVSSDIVVDPKSRDNSRLFHTGTLYAAKFNPEGTGHWIPLVPETPVDPIKPSVLGSEDPVSADTTKKLELPSRTGVAGTTEGQPFAVDPTNEAVVLPAYVSKGGTLVQATLKDYYDNAGAILMDCYLAANLVGATPTARPEDLELSPFDPRVVFIAYTDGIPASATVVGDAYPDSRIFRTAKYSAEIDATQPPGGLYKITEDSADGTGTTFTWERFLQGGEAGAVDCAGFAQIDNMAFDAAGNVWMVTDMSTSRHNGLSTSYTGATRCSRHRGSSTMRSPDRVTPWSAPSATTGCSTCRSTVPTRAKSSRSATVRRAAR